MARHLLGLSAYYHDSAAALLTDGHVVAAAQEERFSRRKHDADFPAAAIRYCLDSAGITLGDVEAVVFYDKPLLKFERLLETYVSFAPRGLRSFVRALPVWLKDKLYLKETLKRELAVVGGIDRRRLPELLFSEHHRSHAASAFFFSPFERAAVLCLDGVGEWATTSAWRGHGNRLEPLWQLDFPHSLGLLYSACTGFAGFEVNSGEYKLMGLAPYGEPRHVDLILAELMDLKADGTFRLNLKYFDYCTGLSMTNAAFASLFGGPARAPGAAITQREMDLAASVQRVTEEVVLRLARSLRAETGESSLCLAGGVALNCVANGRLQRAGVFEELWIQPAAGDAGGALGAAAVAWYEHAGQARRVAVGRGEDGMASVLLGPAYSTDQCAAALDRLGANYQRLDEATLIARAADALAGGRVVGWFQGRMEFGPRALGARSILADPRDPAMQSRLNRMTKLRESFRPFAPAVLAERAAEFFELDVPSPYMLLVTQLAAGQRSLPAVTHVDGSARVQTVAAADHPRLHRLLGAFGELTGCPVLLNTSFNVRGEPIVCTPDEAYHDFMHTDLDHLVIGELWLSKADQPASNTSPPTVRSGPERHAPASPAELRRFGITFGAALALLFGLVLPLLRGGPWPLWPWPAGILPALVALIHPASLRLPRTGWLRLGHVLGRLTTPLVLGLVYFAVVLPIGLIRRAARDPMARRFEPTATSYRVAPRHGSVPELDRPY